MVHRARLDAELVRRGLARSREQAAAVIAEGRVRVGGLVATKASTGVDPAASVVVDTGDAEEYVSRGGHKLAGALDVFQGAEPPLDVESRRALDVGASTGGFTDVLLRRGAAHVVAVDVGYGQLAWPLQNDPRVTVLDRTNVRDLTPEVVGAPVDLVVGDLSFISLAKLVPALRAVAADTADYVLMVKPQFEVGKGNVGSGGVVRDPALRAAAIRQVADAAMAEGLGVQGLTASLLPGPAGNVEYFLWLRSGAPPLDPDAAERAVAEGPA
ncbi:MAG: rRNA (cytidine1920-2-O)/16S rRNA (cytidine1409-2-O)-methyltransferase [Frankiaceae bacterium]|nr:rRNA (cytidine1920-2-O)/16S rRNA (cytidine1409-2-O)-methyltransferase [Frankiaceae bacterium]